MKRHLVLALVILAASAMPASAGTWIFGRSYYSHDPATQVRIGRQYSPAVVFTRPQGEYISAGFRFNVSTIIVPGQTVDNTNLYQRWYQVGTQF